MSLDFACITTRPSRVFPRRTDRVPRSIPVRLYSHSTISDRHDMHPQSHTSPPPRAMILVRRRRHGDLWQQCSYFCFSNNHSTCLQTERAIHQNKRGSPLSLQTQEARMLQSTAPYWSDHLPPAKGVV